MRIVVVCTGNLCRSPMAEAVLRTRLAQLHVCNVTVSSMGVYGVSGAPPTDEAQIVCRERGLDISAHRARGLVDVELAQSHLALVMEPVHKDLLSERYPDIAARVALFGAWPRQEETLDDVVPDPIGRTVEYYRRVFRQIDQHAARIAAYLAQGAMCQPPST